MKKVISVHIPKTAGTSFRKTIDKNYKKPFYDYGNKVGTINLKTLVEFNTKFEKENINNFDIIHGHFLPIKYEKLYNQGWKFITWLREPAQRLYSQYYHLKRNFEIYGQKNYKETIGYFIIHNKLSVEEFVLNDISKNYYQRFFHNFPSENYYFIGVIENYKNDLQRLSQLLDVNFEYQFENPNPNKTNSIYEIHSDILNQIKKVHNEDYKLYEKICSQN